MRRVKTVLMSLQRLTREHPFRASLLVAGTLLLVGLPWFFLPKTVEFSYAGSTCLKEMTLLPQFHGQVTDSKYEVEFENIKSVGGVPIVATSACLTPRQLPEKGDVIIATSPWSGGLFQQRYTLTVGDEPRVDLAAFAQPVPVTKPLMVPLDQPDAIHRYELKANDKTVECNDDKDTTLLCDINQLMLDQGEKYSYSLSRQFGSQAAEPISQGTLETLKAVRVVKADIRDGEVVFAKPTKLQLTLDKPVNSAVAKLKTSATDEAIKVTTNDKLVTVTFAKPLQRDSDYKLVLGSVEAIDGSTLIEPYELKFKVSGGPKVVNISIGSNRVDPNARAVVTFDQDLSAEQDVAKLVSVRGGPATVTKLGSRQVAVQLSGLDRCAPFKINVASGVLSRYAIKNQRGWTFSSRTVCYTASTYGTSLQGRPLVAYHFGNQGPLTLYTGAIHGNEVSSKYLMESWMAELESNPDRVKGRQIVVIPNVNPDGVAAGTRNNSLNVNLSRNFPTSNWVKDIDDTDGKNKGGGGEKPLSEPEAAALARFTQSLSPRLLVSYHAVGSLVVGDPGGYSAGKAAEYARLVGYRNATGQGGTFDYDITGAYEDWAYRNAGIPSMIVELGSYSYYSFDHHRAAIWAMLD